MIAELSDRQHGPVARPQLLEMGLGRGAIDWRVEMRRLHPVYRSVYVPGRRQLTREGRWMAAVLACGPEAVVSHRTAAALWRMREGEGGATVEVTVPRRVRGYAGITARIATLASDERTVLDGIPVTTVPRTLLDLAAVLRPEALRRALEQAEALRLGDPVPLVALLERHHGRRGAARLKALLDEGPLRPRVLRSVLESRFLALVEDAGLPSPETNVRLEIGGVWIEVDCVWRDERLVVELDGRTHHDTEAAFERDRVRDRRLQAAAWRVVRVTWRALEEDPDAVVADLAALLTTARHAIP
jgi:very-short-patch-repair endonuclease